MIGEENKVVAEFRAIKKEYAYDADIFSEEDPKSATIKYIIDNRLTLAEKTIILLYAECASFRKLGEMMGISHTTIRKEVVRIRAKILQEYENLH